MLTIALFALQAASAQGGPRVAQPVLAADTGVMHHANNRAAPVARAVRVSAGAAIHVDGRLDDAAWAQSTPMTEFYQTAPREGEPATERMEVRITYDDAALYVGARLFDGHPGGVIGQLARRDAFTESDLFEIAIDSYHDHNTAFVFAVNPSGVKTDRIV